MGEGALKQGGQPSVTPELFIATLPSKQTQPFTCPSPTKSELLYILGK